jgi:Protein of unknown function (DUF642)/PEP-CTERM motif
MNKKILLVIAVLASAALCAHAQNLVANPGFETGDFTGWTTGGNFQFCSVGTDMPHTGNFAADLGPAGSDGTLSQTFATSAGQMYSVSFWLAVDAGGTPNDFSASFAGNTFYTITNDPGHGYNQYSAIIPTTGSSSTLLFSFRDDPLYWHLDDVDVHLVPEPGTLGLIALGALGLVGAFRKRLV